MQESSAEMTVQSSGFQEYLAEEIKKYGGVMIPVKAGLMERLLVKEAEIKKLHPNPDDEFCMPGIGPNDRIISDCITGAAEYDGAMPVITVKDTVYQSADGAKIDCLLKRSELFAGQAPESFKFQRYYQIHNEVSDEEIGATAGSSEIAYRHGMEIRMVKGSERNLKITTIEDLETFETILKGGN